MGASRKLRPWVLGLAIGLLLLLGGWLLRDGDAAERGPNAPVEGPTASHVAPAHPLARSPRLPGRVRGPGTVPELDEAHDSGLGPPPPRETVRVVVQTFDETGAAVWPVLASISCEGGPSGFDLDDGGDGAAFEFLLTHDDIWPCVSRVKRRDGLLWAQSDTVEFELSIGPTIDIEHRLPSERTGGLGVGISASDVGIMVRSVLPGSPAEALGLEPGDVIVEVDGLPADALELDEFIEVATGPEGTDVEIVVAYEADTGLVLDPMSLTRGFLEAEEQALDEDVGHTVDTLREMLATVREMEGPGAEEMAGRIEQMLEQME